MFFNFVISHYYFVSKSHVFSLSHVGLTTNQANRK